jgi:hypothetical protein
LDAARRQIQQYEQQRSKAERVLQRLQTEYEAQIAVRGSNGARFCISFPIFQRLVQRQQEQTSDYEKFQQEVRENVRAV